MRRPRVLVIEDDPSMLRLFDSLLAANGYLATAAGTIEAALDAVESTPAPFGLVVIGFPSSIDPVSAVHALRRHARFGPASILGLTSSDRAEDIEMLLDAGCDAYLVRPFDLAEFQHLLVALIQEGPAQGASVYEPPAEADQARARPE